MLVVLFISVAEDTESPLVDRLVTVCRIVVVVFKSVEECADLCKFTDNSFNVMKKFKPWNLGQHLNVNRLTWYALNGADTYYR